MFRGIERVCFSPWKRKKKKKLKTITSPGQLESLQRSEEIAVYSGRCSFEWNFAWLHRFVKTSDLSTWKLIFGRLCLYTGSETGSCNGKTGGPVVLAAGTSDYSASFVSNRRVKSWEKRNPFFSIPKKKMISRFQNMQKIQSWCIIKVYIILVLSISSVIF